MEQKEKILARILGAAIQGARHRPAGLPGEYPELISRVNGLDLAGAIWKAVSG